MILIQRVKLITGIFIGIIIVIILICFIQWDYVFYLLEKVSVRTILISMVLYLTGYVFRALRFFILTKDENIKFKHVFFVSLIHGFFNRLLPFRIGEISYAYFMKKKLKLPYSQGITTLVISRIYDSISALIIFIAAITLIKGANFYAFIGCLIIIFLFLCLILYSSLAKFILNLGLFNKKIRQFLHPSLQVTRGSLSIKKSMLITIFSITNWMSVFIMFKFLLQEFGINLHFSIVIIGSTFANLTNILPISGMGSFGSMEAGWTFGFKMVGLDTQISLATGFLINLLAFIYISFYSLIGFIWLLLYKIRDT